MWVKLSVSRHFLFDTQKLVCCLFFQRILRCPVHVKVIYIQSISSYFTQNTDSFQDVNRKLQDKLQNAT